MNVVAAIPIKKGKKSISMDFRFVNLENTGYCTLVPSLHKESTDTLILVVKFDIH